MHRGRAGALAAPWVVASALAAYGCSTESAGRGEACTRTAECAAGLACVAGKCSADLEGLGGRGTVPMLMPEPQDAGSPDARADAGDGGPAAVDAGASDDDAG